MLHWILRNHLTANGKFSPQQSKANWRRSMNQNKYKFPSKFTWGAATSAYQIEGAWDLDGKGESIWDRFSHKPGNITNGETGDVACDHYHRWRDDIQLMKDIGLNAYRFSISWSRLLPEGTGRINTAGIDFYSRLVDELLNAGVEPFVTLYHWDLPQALQDAGGWPERCTAEAFVEYAGLASRELGDRVKHWITFNEPFVSSHQGYFEGNHAPGHQNLDEALATAHHQLLAHGWALPVIRDNATGGQVGLVLDLNRKVPASPSYTDRAAAWIADGMFNRWFLDPISGRDYPPELVRYYGHAMDFIQPGDMSTIAAPLDFLGVNYYSRNIIRSEDVPEEENQTPTVFKNLETTAMGWEVYPQGLYEILGRLHFNYDFPALYVTENGAAYPDRVNAQGKVEDPLRIAYLREHLKSISRAIAIGVPVRGYFAWSLMDNFEWSHGYTKRFGLVYVDFKTQQRIPKASARWYRDVIQANQVIPAGTTSTT
jgi:beta-glucosidase